MENLSAKAVLFFFMTAQSFAPTWAQVCPRRCHCPEEVPMCLPGVSLVLDDCACCLVCAGQKGQACSEMKPCDTRNGLQCDYSVDVHKRTGICTVSVGNVCVLEGLAYQHGQIFFPSCKYQCVCQNGQIACIPRCSLDVMLPGPDCPMPRKVQVPGECCEKWVCEPQTKNSALGGFAMAAYRQEEVRSFDGWDPRMNCIEQTTEWGACSKTCGMGVSTRVTNKNDRCEMVKQSRLCKIRPCEDLQGQATHVSLTQRGSICQRVVRSEKAVHLSHNNCTSILSYKPRYCGSCTDGRCCTPHRTKTSLVDLQCSDGKTIRKPVMAILTCVCHTHCPRDNASWEPSQLQHGGVRV
ncbi:CCN family member 3-like isoform X1 [Cyprinodon tularosa]|uniref:CCN family member 3-like isoform X1 n=1 Tax=Cyprinodon tularosa TaxID=77115 RepID=UPI0018E28BF6|nr:CCN family member 3-like isoform X1 [Cyprinodon tularosa]